MKVVKKSARLVTFLVVNRHHLIKANQNLVAMAYFSNMLKVIPVKWKAVILSNNRK